MYDVEGQAYIVSYTHTLCNALPLRFTTWEKGFHACD